MDNRAAASASSRRLAPSSATGYISQILPIKFTDAGGRVTFRAWYGDGGMVFQVADTGIGIAAENITIALAPFRQVEHGLARKYHGSGLGLPLAKSLAELHGGSLDLQSEPGVGTTITVRLPASRVVVIDAVPQRRAS